jgi:hypothetical protein
VHFKAPKPSTTINIPYNGANMIQCSDAIQRREGEGELKYIDRRQREAEEWLAAHPRHDHSEEEVDYESASSRDGIAGKTTRDYNPGDFGDN